MKYFDRLTGFFIADPSIDPLSGRHTTPEKVRSTTDKYILSASGWRAVFALSGDEEDRSKEVSTEDMVIASTVARTYLDYLGVVRPRILVGMDARPTGEVLADVIVRTMISLGAEVTHLFFASAPEIMAYSNAGYDGFFYISASHNPIGHNGYKFGSHGGVYNKAIIDEIIPRFMENINSDDVVVKAFDLVKHCDPDYYSEVLMKHDGDKLQAFDYYRSFVLRIATAHKLFHIPFGIVAEMNGSARAASIDITHLNKMGAKVWVVNGQPRQIMHAIVPEGENLELCRKTLEEVHAKDKDYILGYVPDNDGDRGNFVYVRPETGKAYILHAQEVFALVATIDLAHQVMVGDRKPAIAVNGPTSSMIDEIAKKLGVTVFRSDVGEANVVTLAEMARNDGYQVHICGEGSNGGCITHPAKVRDPMNSIMSIAKLYSIDGLYDFILSAFGVENDGEISLEKIIDALPKFTTTPAFSKDAVLRIKSKDFDALKLAYEKIFLEEVDGKMKEHHMARWEVRQIEGTKEDIGIGPEHRLNPSTGGYKIVFYDEKDSFIAYIWLSKSKTEPVMRVMADVKGDDTELHDALLDWQRSMVERADRAIC